MVEVLTSYAYKYGPMLSVVTDCSSRRHQLAVVYETLRCRQFLRREELEVDMINKCMINKCVWMATSSLIFRSHPSVELMDIEG